MQATLEIAVQGPALQEDEDALILRFVERFTDLLGDIESLRLVVNAVLPHRGEHPKYSAHLQVVLPGGEITIATPAAADRFAVIQDAVDAAARQLEDYAVHHRYDSRRIHP
jgi:hypothetical protein